LLELKNITKIYPAPDGTHETTILSAINLVVSSGETVAIVGPSGSGKSTLLNIIGTLDKPTAGNIFFNSQDITTLKDKEMAALRNKKIGFIFQQHHLLPQCTVLENVLLPTLVSGLPAQYERAGNLLEKIGLSGHLAHLPSQLSGGEQQRVAIVRALINQPDLILADEPTGSLDQKNSENLGKLLVELNRDNKVTLIVVTHSLDLAAKMKTAYRLNEGALNSLMV
jgi:ABC-type lipoprotein export system ATPase subunit